MIISLRRKELIIINDNNFLAQLLFSVARFGHKKDFITKRSYRPIENLKLATNIVT